MRPAVILVVDDEVLVRNFLVRVLTLNGYTVIAAADGMEALEMLREFAGTIDILLMDVEMPRLNGFTLAQQIHRESDKIKFIFMSGKFQMFIEMLPANSQLKNFIEKPFQLNALLEMVQRILAEPPTPHEPQP